MVVKLVIYHTAGAHSGPKRGPSLRALLQPADTPSLRGAGELSVAALALAEARFDAGVLLLHDGNLDQRLGNGIDHLEGLRRARGDLAGAASTLPLEAYLYCMPAGVASSVPILAEAGVHGITVQVETFAYARYLTEGEEQAPVRVLAGALAATIDAARREGVQEVSLACLLGSNVTQLLEELANIGTLPDRIVVLTGHSPTWTYIDTCERQIRDLRHTVEHVGYGDRVHVAAMGGISMASLPFVVRAGAQQLTLCDVNSYACYGQQQLFCAERRRAERTGRIEPHQGELAAWVRCDATHRWVAAARAEDYAMRLVRESAEATDRHGR